LTVDREEAAIVLESGIATDWILRKGTMAAMPSLADAPLTASLELADRMEAA
jgi:hypothetical protein